MAKAHILIVEDEADIQQLVSYNLIKAGFHVCCADSAEEAQEQLEKEKIDCVLLDLMLPKMNGLELCSTIKCAKNRHNRELAVIMMTAKGEEEDVVTGFTCGADDYITKPFSPRVLIARVKAVLKRSLNKAEEKDGKKTSLITAGGLEIDKKRHEVKCDGRLVPLTATEFGILCLLMEKPGWVFTRQQIIDSVRGYDFLVTPRAIDVQIFGLRKKLEDKGEVIETVRGIGYRFRSAPTEGAVHP